MAQAGSNESYAMVVIGKTGSGKSLLCNLLTNSTDFPVGRGALSKTEKCQSKTARTRLGQLTVVDTPGTRDVKDKDKARDELCRALQDCPDGVDAFVVVIRCDVRLTDEECKAVEDAVDMFGPECFKRVIVVFTHGDVYNNDESEFRNDLEMTRKEIPRFDSLLSKFGNRFLLMDNGRSCNKDLRARQLTAVMNFVHTVASLNPDRFSQKDVKSAKKVKKTQALEEELMQQAEKVKELRSQMAFEAEANDQRMKEMMMKLAMLHMHSQIRNEMQIHLHRTDAAAHVSCVKTHNHN